MSKDYGTHASYMKWVEVEASTRYTAIREALRKAFTGFIVKREVEVIQFSEMSALQLAEVIIKHPVILKPLLAICNIAGRAIGRDLGIKINTYKPRLTGDTAKLIAGYLMPHLPPYLEVPSLAQIDRFFFIDKEIRRTKGNWEKEIVAALNAFSRIAFRKRKFLVGGKSYELDAASPVTGDVIHVGIDVKRIEARADIHKRSDEIINKAMKMKVRYPDSRFAAVIYYPFIDQQVNVRERLQSDVIDHVVFAGSSESSINNAVRILVASLKLSKRLPRKKSGKKRTKSPSPAG